MKVSLQPGKYVVAVSGGVDSVVLLRALYDLPNLKLVVAHFDHGIRPDSREDRLFVEELAGNYGLQFVYEEGRLGPGASEATARQARYEFLRRVMAKNNAAAIITAHHQDDVLETAIINLLRGTKRKGLTSLINRDDIRRPLLEVSKNEILEYARRQKLTWREDSTNQDEAYLRNYIRRQILPRLSGEARSQLLNIIAKQEEANETLDTLLVKLLSETASNTLDRQQFINFPHDMAREVMAAWLRAYGVRDFDSKTLERLVVAAKVAKPGSRFDVLRSVNMTVGADTLALTDTER